MQCVTIKLSQWSNKIVNTTWILHSWTQCQIVRSKSVWSYKINIKGKEIVFGLDTHAEATAISKEIWEELENQHFNQQIKICLVLPAKQAVFRSLVVTLPTRENLHSSQQLWWITSNNLLGLSEEHLFSPLCVK